jgi:DNA-binding NarL/FixJ family response regulator
MTLRVFLVQDSAMIRDSLIAALEELAPVEIVGFADDEPTATSWLRCNPRGCEVFVIDIFLKRGSGLGFLREAAKLSRAIKVVLSNYATADIRTKCLKLGADRVFDKSNEFDALVAYCARLDTGATGHGRL